MKNLILLFSLITLFSCSTEEPCEPFPILAIDDATDLTDVSANISGSIILPTCEGTVTSQGFVYSKTTLPKIDDLVIEKAQQVYHPSIVSQLKKQEQIFRQL